MDKSQSLLLAAVILGSQKPNPPGVLRSAMYSPLRTLADVANSASTLSVTVEYITIIPLEFMDVAPSVTSLEVVKTIAAKPEFEDTSMSSTSLVVTRGYGINQTLTDVAVSGTTVTTTKYTGVVGFTDDVASSSATLGVTKL